MYILAHDLGTSGNKATLFDESGLLIASRTVAYPTDYASGNRAEQNPHHWWKAIVDTTQALLELVSPNDIAGVALSGQMMGCLCIDKDGNPLRPHMLYCDQRSQEEEAKLTEKIDPLHFYEITGHRISASYSVEKLMWVKKHEPEIFAQTAKMLNAKDYINYRLCGTIATDPSDASGTNAYDLNRWQWSEEIIEAAELDLSLFPEVRSSIDVIGEITNEAARETGLLAGTPVICGGGDGSCAGVGVGCVAPGTAYNYLGSSSWVALTVEKPIVDEQRRTMNWAHVVPGMLASVGNDAGGRIILQLDDQPALPE
ncbi:FGGY family carbohydrate kinase [Bacteroides thetaiotaomicron]|nr:FGGY family carbohydrate kinase [Bacteroides thetaiotaomicron]